MTTMCAVRWLELCAELEGEYGSFHIFRPNRDVRFSRDKSPYKTAIGAVTEGRGGEAYYVQLSAEGLFAASGYYRMASDQLERFRVALDDTRAGRALERALRRGEPAGLSGWGSSAEDRATRLSPAIIPASSSCGTRESPSVGASLRRAGWVHARASRASSVCGRPPPPSIAG